MDFYTELQKLTPLRQKQLRHAVFVNLVESIDEITTISKSEREIWWDKFHLTPFKVKSEQKSKDGSTKWALQLADGNIVETVLLEFRDGRNTVCISSQAGCASGCVFCATGQNGFKRNLTTWEIVAQVLLAARYLKNVIPAEAGIQTKGTNYQISPTSPDLSSGRRGNEPEDDNKNNSNSAMKQSSNVTDRVTNVVFMGMGEPMNNLENVLAAIRELNDPLYFNLGRRHIAVSTCGPLENLKKFVKADTGTTLAISLHASNQKMREKLMPIAKSNPLPELFQVLEDFVAQTNKQVTYEYIMLAGINDSAREAEELSLLLKGRLAFVNLIAYNDIDGSDFGASSRQAIETFLGILHKNGVPATLRVSLGDDIAAACGQLAGNSAGIVMKRQ